MNILHGNIFWRLRVRLLDGEGSFLRLLLLFSPPATWKALPALYSMESFGKSQFCTFLLVATCYTCLSLQCTLNQSWSRKCFRVSKRHQTWVQFYIQVHGIYTIWKKECFSLPNLIFLVTPARNVCESSKRVSAKLLCSYYYVSSMSARRDLGASF